MQHQKVAAEIQKHPQTKVAENSFPENFRKLLEKISFKPAHSHKTLILQQSFWANFL